MEITTRGGKQTIDPPMPSTKENMRQDNDNVVKGSGEAEESNGKDAEVPNKVPCLGHHHQIINAIMRRIPML